MSTYTPIQSFTLTSASSSIVLSNLPQNYVDLIVQVTFGASTGTDIGIRFNNDTAVNYSTQRVAAVSSSGTVGATRETAVGYIAPRTPANQATTITTAWSINVMNYSNSSTNKTTVQRYGYSSAFSEMDTGVWRSTAPITTITLITATGGANFSAGTIVNVYGVEAGTPKAQGGNIVTTDGTYWYHTFLSSGTFTTYSAITADYLVVAGGGGAANTGGVYVGGGGAGGLRCTVGATGGGGALESALSLSASQTYTITVGAGGRGGGHDAGWPNGVSGSNSSISGTGITTITSTGGGASNNSGAGNSGGSGGGGAGNSGAGGAGTANQGYAGGAGNSAGSTAGGGGGGAGAVGSNAGTSTGGNGGNGVTTSISGTSTTYAGGGGGAAGTTAGTGGTGGGGAGKTTGFPNNGSTNTGGGGGATNSYDGGAGGSGIVIIRYAV